MLTGAEAELVRQSLAGMAWPFLSRPNGAAAYTEDELSEFGLPLYDGLAETQKLAVIHQVANALFGDNWFFGLATIRVPDDYFESTSGVAGEDPGGFD